MIIRQVLCTCLIIHYALTLLYYIEKQMSSTNNPIKSNGLRALFTYNGFGSIPEYQAHTKTSVRAYGPDGDDFYQIITDDGWEGIAIFNELAFVQV
mgnify:FL=1